MFNFKIQLLPIGKSKIGKSGQESFFCFRDPEKNWNRNCVKGLVASLISVKDTSATTALELVAGDRLYNVVVDTEVN